MSSGKIKAIKNVLLWDGTGSDPIKNGFMLVEGSRILEVGPSSDLNVPKA